MLKCDSVGPLCTYDVSLAERFHVFSRRLLAGSATWYLKAFGFFCFKTKNVFKCFGGTGVPQDYAEAVNWFRKSAEQGSASGQIWLGNCYLQGKGVEQNPVEAVKWFRKAAEQVDDYGQVSLGICYMEGWGVKQDYAEAVKQYRKSAEQGNAEGQVRLGACYLHGLGVKQDKAEAMKWIRKAAAQGEPNAMAFLKQMENN